MQGLGLGTPDWRSRFGELGFWDLGLDDAFVSEFPGFTHVHTFEGSDMLCMYAYPGFASRLQLTHTCKKGHAKANVLSDAAFVGSVSRIGRNTLRVRGPK